VEFAPDRGLPFTGIRTYMRLPHSRQPEHLDQVDFAVVGFPFDIGTTFGAGARFGPEAIRRSSARIHQYNMALDVNVFEHLKGLDFGDAQVVIGQTEASYAELTDTLQAILSHGVVPAVLGGDHSVSLPELRAYARKHGPLALVHFDAHPDTWGEIYGTTYNHGTPFHHAVKEGLVDPRRSIQVGMRGSQHDTTSWQQSRDLGLELITMDEFDRLGVAAVVERVRMRVASEPAFLSFDIDALDPAYAPGTGTPELGGFTSREVLRLLRGLAGINFVGFDIVEVLPAHDPAGITSLAAAEIVFEFISLLAVQRRGPN